MNVHPLFDPRTPVGFGAFCRKDILKSIGMSLLLGGLYSYTKTIRIHNNLLHYVLTICHCNIVLTEAGVMHDAGYINFFFPEHFLPLHFDIFYIYPFFIYWEVLMAITHGSRPHVEQICSIMYSCYSICQRKKVQDFVFSLPCSKCCNLID